MQEVCPLFFLSLDFPRSKEADRAGVKMAKARSESDSASDSGSHASSFDIADDQDWADWVDDEGGVDVRGIVGQDGASFSEQTKFHAIFTDEGGKEPLRSFRTAREALEDARGKGCDFVAVVRRLHLDPLQVIRLLNYLRRNAGAVKPEQISKMQGDEKYLNDDEELIPVPGLENDGLLQIDFDDIDVELGGEEQTEEQAKIAELQSELQAARLAFEDLRGKYAESLHLDHHISDQKSSSSSSMLHTDAKPKRDDDSHYFTSYASHEIHQTMISDKVRTLSYAKFLLSPANAHLIRGKTVMDVGCGSGILSLFAARAGARQVIAIDASDVARRARENIERNGMQGIIKVHQGKIEELDTQLAEYRGKVDIIVSEWMGYFLLYESMLPSVLYARDAYLAKDGILAPSHTRMVLSAVSSCDLITERMTFWDDVYGFELSGMRKGLADEAWTDCLQANEIATSTSTLLDLAHHTLPVRQPRFEAPFSLKVLPPHSSTKATRPDGAVEIQAFASWFDTWFTTDGRPHPPSGQHGDMKGGEELDGLPPVEVRCPEPSEVHGLTDLRRDAIAARAPEDKGKSSKSDEGSVISFTTGPQGLATHWKQTLFVLKEPIVAKPGAYIVGTLRSTPSPDNSRELDVEIHYALRDEPLSDAAGAAATAGGDAKKKVEAMTVQLFAVR